MIRDGHAVYYTKYGKPTDEAGFRAESGLEAAGLAALPAGRQAAGRRQAALAAQPAAAAG